MFRIAICRVVSREVASIPSLSMQPTCCEAKKNQWAFSLTIEQADLLIVEDVVDFLEAVIEHRQQKLLDNHASPLKFYCWHDKQAGQLRFSMVSDLRSPSVCRRSRPVSIR